MFCFVFFIIFNAVFVPRLMMIQFYFICITHNKSHLKAPRPYSLDQYFAQQVDDSRVHCLYYYVTHLHQEWTNKIRVAGLSGTRETLTPLVWSILETFSLNADQCYHDLLVGPEPGFPTYQLRRSLLFDFSCCGHAMQ